MSRLYFIRHAQSEANRQKIMGSRLPVSLSEEGKADAVLIASRLKPMVEIQRIISSPLPRTLQTARPFSAAYGLPVEPDERIIEQDVGIFSGMSYDLLKTFPSYEPDTMARWDWLPQGGGESYRMIAERVSLFLKDLEKEDMDRNILVVSHSITLRIMRAVLENTLPTYPRRFPKNGEIWLTEFTSLGKVHEVESLFLGTGNAMRRDAE
ncbi:histidine phosphatase family protein [Parasphaerochaeta coccoides]|uniref:Phosphoglycerate mutase n=1 Tax=Parasphaerochaeta coccoides (strain ATCC BAA-1237 / DSM 17374 / SPN1) TaxID=760011 RepID=F4GKE7_PARC1|nr:histidine phosphatase family protein [Parasphaerochaeta coccoides]AEC02830.1 Phosphoglycerate mutase [Parasphaerochaeta coccoides DSM 17374]